MRSVEMQRDRLIEELKDAIILQNLSIPELRKFSQICELRGYDKGERIVEQDAVGTDLDLILGGSVDIVLHGKEGGEIIVNTVQAGDVIGEASIFMDLPRTASAVARCESLVAAVPRDRLFGFCNGNPKAGLKIFTFVIYSLLRRLGATSRDLASEKEAVVTREELEKLKDFFPKSLEDMLSD